MWLISNSPKNNNPEYRNHLKFKDYYFYSDKSINNSTLEKGEFFIDGYIQLRETEKSLIKRYEDKHLLEHLYEKYDDNFIHYIKGHFIIIHLQANRFKIYSDHFGIRKFFYWENGSDFIISSNLEEITKWITVEPSGNSICQYVLTFHFTGGRTIFKDIKHNQPSETFELMEGKLTSKYYWHPSELLFQKKTQTDIKEVSIFLEGVIKNDLAQNNHQQVSLSLTGGADTRNLLALFLKLSLEPHLYTYGNPESADCKKASIIANGLGLSHSIHDIRMSPDIFEKYARTIIRQSGGLASIHRVHRLMAIEQERNHADLMFMGTLGGEFVKGVDDDNYITSSIIFRNWETQKISEDQLIEFLRQRSIRIENINIQTLLSLFLEEPYMKGTVIEKKHNSLSYITAHLHDAQDINLYNSVFKEVYTPFLDIDYLELLFSSNFSFDNKEKLSKKWMQKLQNPVYASRFLQVTYPPLLKYRYTGEHKPSEVLLNKYMAAILRIIRKKTTPTYPQNFPVSDWMIQFIKKNLPLCNYYQILRDTFNLEDLLSEFHSEQHMFNESYWLKYSNPILMRFILEEFND